MGAAYFLGGGIGSGKSAAARWFRTFGAAAYAGDDAGRAVLAPGTAETARVAARWPSVIGGDGAIDRRALGRLVFADAGQLRELESITATGIARHIREFAQAHGDEVVLIEVPVLRDLAEAGWEWIVVDAPDEVRIERAVARGGITVAEVRHVMDRQPGRGEWLEAATWVIDNSGDDEDLAEQCRRVWAEIAPG
ncbi:MAG: dephospho-CoA kinase [Acidimicrobiia bacterium]|nr:dephospho-CoA kinase [Acidimicrobiia bacterium]